MIAVAIASVPATITGDIEFGRMCEKRIFLRGTPTERAANTYSFSRCASTEPRRRRAKIGMFTTPTAIITCQRPGPSIATIAIAKRRPGMASMTSIIRMTTESGQRPTKPAKDPSRSPIERPMATETTPISSE